MVLSLDIIGFMAAVLTTLGWLPQAIKTLRTKDTSSLSVVTQGILALGTGLWLVYGLMTGSGPIILANGCSFVLVAAILVMKLRYG